MKMKNKPHNVTINHDNTKLSGYEILTIEKQCQSCGGTFILWHEQRKCSYCGREYEPKTIMWACQ